MTLVGLVALETLGLVLIPLDLQVFHQVLVLIPMGPQVFQVLSLIDLQGKWNSKVSLKLKLGSSLVPT